MERPAKNASAISASSLSLTGRSCSTRGQTREAFQVPGKSYNSASSCGKPFTLQLTDTVDGALSPAATPEPREP